MEEPTAFLVTIGTGFSSYVTIGTGFFVITTQIAISCYEKSLTFVEDLGVMMDLGNLYRFENNVPEAERCFKMAIENGTYSRFLFYNLATENAWSDPFDVNMSESVIKELQIRVQSIGNKCNARKHKVLISKDTQNEFNDFMRDTYNEYIQVMTTELQSCIFRMGIIFFRVATIYTILEHEYEPLEDCFALSANSMMFAKDFVSVMLANTYKTYAYLSEDKNSEPSEQKILGWEILEKLGGIFTTQQANEFGNRETIKRYLRNWVANGVVEKKAHGIYAKKEN